MSAVTMQATYQIWIVLLLVLRGCVLLSGESHYKLVPDYEILRDDEVFEERSKRAMEVGGSGSGEIFLLSLIPSGGTPTSSTVQLPTILHSIPSSRLSTVPPKSSAMNGLGLTLTPGRSTVVSTLEAAEGRRTSLPTSSLQVTRSIATVPSTVNQSPVSGSPSKSPSLLLPLPTTSPFLLLPTSTPAPPVPDERVRTRVTLTFETSESLNDTQNLVESIGSEIVDYLEEEFGIAGDHIISVTVEITQVSQRKRELAKTIVLVQIEVDIRPSEQEDLEAQVESDSFTISVSGATLTATKITITETSVFVTPIPEATSTPGPSESYHLMTLFWYIVGGGGVCVLLIVVCTACILCLICRYGRRKRRRMEVYLEGFEFEEHPKWMEAYYPTLERTGRARPLSYVVHNHNMTDSTFNIVHEL